MFFFFAYIMRKFHIIVTDKTQTIQELLHQYIKRFNILWWNI